MIHLDLEDPEGAALIEMIDYYRSSNFGCGGSGPTDDTQRHHIGAIREIERRVLRQMPGAESGRRRVAKVGDDVEYIGRPDKGVGEVVGQRHDGRAIVLWPDGYRGPSERYALRVVTPEEPAA